MGRRSNGWRAAARSAAYDFPKLKQELAALQGPSAAPEEIVQGGGEHRPTEECALRLLPHVQQRRLEAVEQAVTISSQLSSGPSRVKLIELVYFRKSHTIEGAAMQIPVSVQMAKIWSNDFLLLVWARLRGK